MLKFDDLITNANVCAVFFSVVFNDDFSALLWETLLPIIVPVTHIV